MLSPAPTPAVDGAVTVIDVIHDEVPLKPVEKLTFHPFGIPDEGSPGVIDAALH